MNAANTSRDKVSSCHRKKQMLTITVLGEGCRQGDLQMYITAQVTSRGWRERNNIKPPEEPSRNLVKERK